MSQSFSRPPHPDVSSAERGRPVRLNPQVWVPPASGTITDTLALVDTWGQTGRVHNVVFKAATISAQAEIGASRVYPIEDILGRGLAVSSPSSGTVHPHASLSWGMLPAPDAIWPLDIWGAVILMNAADHTDAGTNGVGPGIRAHSLGHKGRYSSIVAGAGGDTLTSTYRLTVTDVEGNTGIPGATMHRRAQTDTLANNTVMLVNTETGLQQAGSSTDDIASSTALLCDYTHALVVFGRPAGTGSATAEFSFIPYVKYIPPDILGARHPA